MVLYFDLLLELRTFTNLGSYLHFQIILLIHVHQLYHIIELQRYLLIVHLLVDYEQLNPLILSMFH